MPKERRLEDFITMPAGQGDAENLEARILKEAEDFYNEHFGPDPTDEEPILFDLPPSSSNKS